MSKVSRKLANAQGDPTQRTHWIVMRKLTNGHAARDGGIGYPTREAAQAAADSRADGTRRFVAPKKTTSRD